MGSGGRGWYPREVIGADGCLPMAAIMKNTAKINIADSSGGLMKIAGLKDLMVENRLLDALNELLNFLMFTTKNVLAPDQADALTKEVRKLQKKFD